LREVGLIGFIYAPVGAALLPVRAALLACRVYVLLLPDGARRPECIPARAAPLLSGAGWLALLACAPPLPIAAGLPVRIGAGAAVLSVDAAVLSVGAALLPSQRSPFLHASRRNWYPPMEAYPSQSF
jgi:1-acyl-sn-glycerol-3-phosphate acyltransferase